MKIALKYGLAVTAVIAAWVALKHFVLHFETPAAAFVDVFEAVVPRARLGRLSSGVVPAGAGHIGTHHVDPVERRKIGRASCRERV